MRHIRDKDLLLDSQDTEQTDTADSPLSTYLQKADSQMENGEYCEAVKSYEAAALRLSDYDKKLRGAIDETIHYLSTPGCLATAPRRQALKMIQLRNRL